MFNVWSSGIILIQCVLICLIADSVKAKMCHALGSGQPEPDPELTKGKYGQAITLIGEAAKVPYYYIRWKKTITNPDTQQTSEQDIVTYDASGLRWNDASLEQTMSAVFGDETDKMTFSLQIFKLSCDDERLYRCRFSLKDGGDCDVVFNLTVTADPLPPLITNETILVNAGTTVTILCEANVGTPPGDVWWYYVPPGSSLPTTKLTSGVNRSQSSAGDCRTYVKSTLTIQVNREDQDAKYRCVSVLNTGVVTNDFAEVRVAIIGIEPTTTPYVPCQGDGCNSVDGPGGAATVAISASAIAAQVLLFLITMCIL